jgi:zinc protease
MGETGQKRFFSSGLAWALTLVMAWTSLGGDWTRGQSAAAASSVDAAQAAQITEYDVNGLKVLLKRRVGGLTVAAGLFLRGGSRNLTPETAGVESLMLAAATEASEKYPRAKMRTELARLGAGVGYSVNYDYSALTLGTPRANFERAWDIFTDVALKPLFAEADVKLTQERLALSLRDDADDPDTFLQRLQERAAYADHPYANRPQGSVETVTRLTVADLRRHHKRVTQTSQLLLVVVGDLEPERMKSLIAGTFGKLSRGDYRERPVPSLSFSQSSVEVTERPLPTNYVQGVFSAPPMTSPDFPALRLASALLRDRVFEEVRVKRNLSYAPSAFLTGQGANVGGVYVSAVDANQSVKVMLDEIARLQNEPVDAREIRATVAQFLTGYYLAQETNAAQVSELASAELVGGGWRTSLDTIERLRAVTAEDIRRVAQKYMRNLRFVVIGDKNRVDREAFLRSFPNVR